MKAAKISDKVNGKIGFGEWEVPFSIYRKSKAFLMFIEAFLIRFEANLIGLMTNLIEFEANLIELGANLIRFEANLIELEAFYRQKT